MFVNPFILFTCMGINKKMIRSTSVIIISEGNNKVMSFYLLMIVCYVNYTVAIYQLQHLTDSVQCRGDLHFIALVLYLSFGTCATLFFQHP